MRVSREVENHLKWPNKHDIEHLKLQKSNLAQNRRSELPRGWFRDILQRKTFRVDLALSRGFSKPKSMSKMQVKKKWIFLRAKRADNLCTERSNKKWIFPRAKRADNLCTERSTKRGFHRARSAPITFGLINLFLTVRSAKNKSRPKPKRR